MAKLNAISAKVFYSGQHKILVGLRMWPMPEKCSSFWKVAGEIYFYCGAVWIGTFGISMLIQIMANFSNLNEIIKVFFIFATFLGVLAKLIAIKWQHHDYDKLFAQLHERCFEPQDPVEQRIFAEGSQLTIKMRNYYAALSLLALQVMLLAQYFIDSSELPLSTYVPIDIDKIGHYVIMYCFQYVALSICCVMNISFDTLAPSLFLFLSIQLDILARRLRNIGSNMDMVSTHEQLKRCIRYYMHIECLAREMERLLSMPISMQVFCSVFVLVANFYGMSLLSDDYVNFVKFFLYQSCMLIEIFILCYFADEVTHKSAALSQELYKSDWVAWNKQDRKIMLLMMLRFDTPIRIRSSMNRNFSFNLAAFASIVNCSYSYFALLKRVNS